MLFTVARFAIWSESRPGFHRNPLGPLLPEAKTAVINDGGLRAPPYRRARPVSCHQPAIAIFRKLKRLERRNRAFKAMMNAFRRRQQQRFRAGAPVDDNIGLQPLRLAVDRQAHAPPAGVSTPSTNPPPARFKTAMRRGRGHAWLRKEEHPRFPTASFRRQGGHELRQELADARTTRFPASSPS